MTPLHPLAKDWLAHRADASPDALALEFGDLRWSYIELDLQVNRIAGQMFSAGIKPGHHVAVLLPNGPDFVVALHALARVGAVMVPLNLRLTVDELNWQVHHANCTSILCNAVTEAQTQPLSAMGLRVLSFDPPQTPPTEALAGYHTIPENWHTRPLDLTRTQAIVFTSGTTGRPKGAVLTFANHFFSATASAYRLGLHPNDRWLTCMPLYHVGGMSILLRSCLYGTTVVLHEHFDVDAVAHALAHDQITLVSLVPTMLYRIFARDAHPTFSASLRCILLGGAAAPPDLLALARALPVATTYGLSEACSQVATASPRDLLAHPGTVGKPLMFTTVEIRNGDERLLPDEIGEIVVRGPSVMTKYYNDDTATARTLKNGWLHTGDLGYKDPEGNLFVVQRRSDLIVTGGENVYPSEVERVLRTHPDVVEACVMGLPDPEWGQRVVAAVVTNTPESELDAYVREHLAGYKIPRQYVFPPELPKTASGKIKRPAILRLFSTKRTD